MTKSRANQLIDASGVVGNLTTTVVIPQSERQVRPLTKLPPVEQPKAWERAQEIAQEHVTPLRKPRGFPGARGPSAPSGRSGSAPTAHSVPRCPAPRR